jgi:hypothetical protein
MVGGRLQSWIHYLSEIIAVRACRNEGAARHYLANACTVEPRAHVRKFSDRCIKQPLQDNPFDFIKADFLVCPVV